MGEEFTLLSSIQSIQTNYRKLAKEFTLCCYPYGGFTWKNGDSCEFTSKLVQRLLTDPNYCNVITLSEIDEKLKEGCLINIELVPLSGFDGPASHSMVCVKDGQEVIVIDSYIRFKHMEIRKMNWEGTWKNFKELINGFLNKPNWQDWWHISGIENTEIVKRGIIWPYFANVTSSTLTLDAFETKVTDLIEGRYRVIKPEFQPAFWPWGDMSEV